MSRTPSGLTDGVFPVEAAVGSPAELFNRQFTKGFGENIPTPNTQSRPSRWAVHGTGPTSCQELPSGLLFIYYKQLFMPLLLLWSLFFLFFSWRIEVLGLISIMQLFFLCANYMSHGGRPGFMYVFIFVSIFTLFYIFSAVWLCTSFLLLLGGCFLF